MYLICLQKVIVLVYIFLPIVAETALIKGHSRVLGGQKAASHSYPFQAALYVTKFNDNIILCGGSLITQKFILSAANCFIEALMVEIILGAQYLQNTKSKQIRMESQKIISHEYYEPELGVNNIALVELPAPVNLNKKIAIVKLPSKWISRYAYIGSHGKLSGWGLKSPKRRSMSKGLYLTNVRIVDQKDCLELLVRPSNLCGFADNGGGPCVGDDGGPLVVQENGTVIQVGIIVNNMVEFVCTEGQPYIFTKVKFYLDWIETNSDYKIV